MHLVCVWHHMLCVYYNLQVAIKCRSNATGRGGKTKNIKKQKMERQESIIPGEEGRKMLARQKQNGINKINNQSSS